jgi:8-oxo-dGTP pyrophosphatase MutT (NUDIX family)
MIRESPPVKLVVGILTSAPDMLPATEERLTSAFGAIDARSELFRFDWTHYYDAEMGGPIHRQFLSFAKLIQPEAIAPAKIATNEMEMELAKTVGLSAPHPSALRPVNLDPGYLEQSKIVLASTKNFFHRVLVARGIYAEVTLHYREGEWKSFPWTFPDYGSERYHPFFTTLREMYRRQLADAGFKVRIPKPPHRRG